MAEEKVYYPETISESPFPGEPEPMSFSNLSNPTGTFTPTTTKAKSFPKKRTAVELLSTALNTRSKKILQEFNLQDSGGLKIGDFKQGLSGDIRITPNGLTARDIAGITTFSIDGTDGSAVFKGTLQAGTLVGGNGTVLVEESLAGNGRIVLYNGGLPAILIGDPDE